jgi:hypothetical protein
MAPNSPAPVVVLTAPRPCIVRITNRLDGSTYWTKKDSVKPEIFRKVEPYLTFLNISQLERQGAGIQSKVEELEEINQSLRNHHKLKDDAISRFSDQLCVINKLQELEDALLGYLIISLSKDNLSYQKV